MSSLLISGRWGDHKEDLFLSLNLLLLLCLLILDDLSTNCFNDMVTCPTWSVSYCTTPHILLSIEAWKLISSKVVRLKPSPLILWRFVGQLKWGQSIWSIDSFVFTLNLEDKLHGSLPKVTPRNWGS